MKTNNQNVAAETPKTSTTTAPSAPEIRQTAVEDRLHQLTKTAFENKDLKFRGKQRQIVVDILRENYGHKAMSIAQVAKVAEKKGLTAVGGVEPSVRYHLHHLTRDGFVEITNPTFVLEPIPQDMPKAA